MASVISSQGQTMTAVYDDRLRPIFAALGDFTVRRASEVEYEPSTGDWVATYTAGKRCNRCHKPMKGTTGYDGACACGGLIEAATPVEIGRGKSRAEVIEAEVSWLERNAL